MSVNDTHINRRYAHKCMMLSFPRSTAPFLHTDRFISYHDCAFVLIMIIPNERKSHGIVYVIIPVIANDISGTADQINNFYGGIYNNYGNLFLGTLDQYYEMFIIVLVRKI